MFLKCQTPSLKLFLSESFFPSNVITSLHSLQTKTRQAVYLIHNCNTKCKCKIGSFDVAALNIAYLTSDSEKQALS